MNVSGSSPAGSTATFTWNPSATSSSHDRAAAPWPAASGSKLSTTFDDEPPQQLRLLRRQRGAARRHDRQPALLQHLREIEIPLDQHHEARLPEQRLGVGSGRTASGSSSRSASRASSGTSAPGPRPSPARQRPRPTPMSRAMGTISRFRNRSTTWPLSRSTTRPLRRSSGSVESLRHAGAAFSAVPRRRRVAEAERARSSPAVTPRVAQLLARAGAGRRAASCWRNHAAATSWIFSSVSRSRASASFAVRARSRARSGRTCCASSRTASVKPTFSCSSTNLIDVAADAAAEAVEEALLAVHVERRRLLAVERAQPLVAGARPSSAARIPGSPARCPRGCAGRR